MLSPEVTSTAPRTSKLDSRSSRLSVSRIGVAISEMIPTGTLTKKIHSQREDVDEDAAEQDAGGGADAADRAPRAEGDVALATLAEHRRQDRERGR